MLGLEGISTLTLARTTESDFAVKGRNFAKSDIPALIDKAKTPVPGCVIKSTWVIYSQLFKQISNRTRPTQKSTDHVAMGNTPSAYKISDKDRSTSPSSSAVESS